MTVSSPDSPTALAGDARPALLEARALTRQFGHGRTAVHALRGVSLDVAPGRLVAVRGRSGSGKTTLLNILGGLDLPTSGTVRINGHDLGALSDRHRIMLRRGTVGFVFQSFGLIPYLTAAENASIPLRIARTDAAEVRERVARVLDQVGLTGHAEHRPAELSGGQQQRVGIARALAQGPQLLIADEPTGHLDTAQGLQILALLREIADSENTAMIVSSHDRRVADFADEVLLIEDGRIGGQ
ncbi:ABC transporter ATP-binding protein [Actinospica durhamensis]|uniref:ABC transporter ATP-binding protein n=1 Tax=Actinospica durhamensis TaxID=1508375 RepID=A0A941EM29_9ACTN|nr:ABC transporter ATP-binding protein [Actinospica durhamensis]MBR7833455.1 ABC transporter ATP-binding protein [Actinospica durhamensis]